MVDGLPPLPEQYWPGEERRFDRPPRRQVSLVDRKLIQAFGKDCPELKQRDYPMKIEVPSHGFVLATKAVQFEPDGRVRLIPLSVAIFGKARGEDGTPEINTVRGDVGYL